MGFELFGWENYYESIIIISNGNLEYVGTKRSVYSALYSKEKNQLKQTCCSGSN